MKISVIICTYNRSRFLEKSLESLDRLNIPQRVHWELLVIDNNSNDSTKELVQSFLEQQRLPLLYIYEPNQGLSHARNRGIEESSGEVIAFIDDDVVVPVDWLFQVHRAFTSYDADVVSGKVILSFEDTLPTWLDKELQHCFGSFDRGDQVTIFTNPNDGMVGIGANLCFRREVFNSVGYFDIQAGRRGDKLLMGEETELIRRVLINGGRCLYFPEMYLYHVAGSEKLSKQYVLQWHYRFGQWEAQCNKNEDPTLIQTMKYLCWSGKRILCELRGYCSSLLSTQYRVSFKNKVNIVRYAGYISNIL